MIDSECSTCFCHQPEDKLQGNGKSGQWQLSIIHSLFICVAGRRIAPSCRLPVRLH